MVVGICRIRLAIPENASLKGKRSVVRRILSRIRQTFAVAAAEVEEMDAWETAVLGVAAVGNDHRVINSVLDKVVTFVQELYLAEVEDHTIEILHV